jgi:hypothetical protein
MLTTEPGAIYVMDRGYVDFGRLHTQGDSVLRFVPVFRVAARADRDSDPIREST